MNTIRPESIRFGRAICGDLSQAERREWWLGNGRGSYAAGTIAGTLTRRYHGLLIAPLQPPLGRFLVFAKADATLRDGERRAPLYSNRWGGGIIDPQGHLHIESFRLDGRMPTWRYVVGDLSVEMRIWMEPGADTVYLAYRPEYHPIDGEERRLSLEVTLLVNARDHHGNAPPWAFNPVIEPAGERRLLVRSPVGGQGFGLRFHARHGIIMPDHTWYENFDLPVERERGLAAWDNHLCVGQADLDLYPGEWSGIVASLEQDASPYIEEAMRRFHAHDAGLLTRTQVQVGELWEAPAWIQQLILAADNFVFARPLPDTPDGESVIAGYPWFGDWGRDTIIALPGLTLATGRFESARRILETYARFVDKGMLPNWFPGPGEAPEYNSADAALWYIEAWRAYVEVTQDRAALESVFPVLTQIVEAYQNGTRYGIAADPSDGLLRAGEPGIQITWMDAKIGEWVVTPRIGKPVEINALWFNALNGVADFADTLGLPATLYRELAKNTRAGFQHFIDPDGGGLFDVFVGHGPRDRQRDLRWCPAAHAPRCPGTSLVGGLCAGCLVATRAREAPNGPAGDRNAGAAKTPDESSKRSSEMKKDASGLNAERARLEAGHKGEEYWRLWGPYLSERAWGTVREDYSPYGNAWEYFDHDQARSRAYRWNEDGMGGICDEQQRLCLAFTFWNGRDPILKERAFGLTGNQGNHGEDVKEYYFYLDATPSHSYLHYLYKYPQAEYPYAWLVWENARRGRHESPFNLLDSGVFNEDRYWDIEVYYAKAEANEIQAHVVVHNRGPTEASVHLLPTLWFRNTWAWQGEPSEKPQLRGVPPPNGTAWAVEAQHPTLGAYYLYGHQPAELLFTENDTNAERLWGVPNSSPYVKDAFHRRVIQGEAGAVNSEQQGTKCAAWYVLSVPGRQEAQIDLVLSATALPQPFKRSAVTFSKRRAEADVFYDQLLPEASPTDHRIMRQALAGMIWCKQFFHYDVGRWQDGDAFPPPSERKRGRNKQWRHFRAADVISMPDAWEYPWFAAWDLAFHCAALALIDVDFAKDQLELLLRETYLHPNGQIPAYEWAFGDVNPPVLAMAALKVFPPNGCSAARGIGTSCSGWCTSS